MKFPLRILYMHVLHVQYSHTVACMWQLHPSCKNTSIDIAWYSSKKLFLRPAIRGMQSPQYTSACILNHPSWPYIRSTVGRELPSQIRIAFHLKRHILHVYVKHSFGMHVYIQLIQERLSFQSLFVSKPIQTLNSKGEKCRM